MNEKLNLDDMETDFPNVCKKVDDQVRNIIEGGGPLRGRVEAMVLCLAYTRAAAVMLGNVMPTKPYINFVTDLCAKMLQVGLHVDSDLEVEVMITVKEKKDKPSPKKK